MWVRDLIKDIKPVYTTDHIDQALALVVKLQMESIPVVDTETLQVAGIVTREDLQRHENEKSLAITDMMEKGEPILVYPEQHIFEVTGLLLRNKVRFLPVVDENDRYLGIVWRKHLFGSLSDMLSLSEYGTVLTISIDKENYVLSEIIRLIEQEETRVRGLTVETHQNEETIKRISVKLDQTDVSRVIASLRRHGYVVHSESRDDMMEMEYEQRADEFLRFLEI
ncbi:MAG TPA: CBS domain-containing protein [Balneolales bacterium]|jgi:CBS-domain-containing membrane protein|nr:CBS domain-containing protein [Balneolales bacterium]